MDTNNTNTAQNNTQLAKQNIIELFEIEKLPEVEQEEAINKISKVIFEAVLLRVLPTMSEEDLAEYEKLLESGVAPDALFDFFFSKIPDFFKIVAEESESFREKAESVLAGLE